MAVRRDKNGNIIEETTQTVVRTGKSGPSDSTDGGGIGSDEETVLVANSGTGASVEDTPAALERDGVRLRSDAASEDQTVIYRRSKSISAGTPPNEEEMVELPVGWLVVLEGPGKGQVRKLGYGVNSLGRAPTERIVLDFGDEAISKEKHALIAYDPLSRKYHITHHSGTNLTYVNNQLVMSQVILEPYSDIRIGDTRLRFVPLCGDDFAWEDLDDASS